MKIILELHWDALNLLHESYFRLYDIRYMIFDIKINSGRRKVHMIQYLLNLFSSIVENVNG